MAGVFACPECGQELEVEGLSPGREVQCAGCSTWVEVPFLPRASGWKRGRRSTARSPWESKLLRGAILFASVVLLGLVAVRMVVGRVRSGKELVLAALIASVDEAESSRRYDTAFREIEAALAHARTMGLEGSGRLDELKERRDRLSVVEAEVGLAAVDGLNPDEAVGESSRIAERAKHDRALAPLEGAIEAKLDESRRRQAEADLAIARRAFDSGQDAEAFAAAERLHGRAGLLPSPDARRFEGEAQGLIEAAVARSGMALPPVVGRFVAGSAEAYTARLDRHRAEAARARGYLPQPRRSPWAKVWDEMAPFRATVQVVETQEELYLQSKNRTTQVDATIELTRGDQVVWKNRVVTRTRMPLPDLPAYLAGHLATAAKRDPETERRLHDDAVVQFVEQAVKNLRSLPWREGAIRTP
jgi:hypothetical protein